MIQHSIVSGRFGRKQTKRTVGWFFSDSATDFIFVTVTFLDMDMRVAKIVENFNCKKPISQCNFY